MQQDLVRSQRALLRVLHRPRLLPSLTTCIHERLPSKCSISSHNANSHQTPRTRDNIQLATHRTSRLLPPTARTAKVKTISRTMSSDADYASFLDKANQNTGAAEQQSTSNKKSYGTKSVDTAVPKVLEQVEEYYISDADEPFEPVALKYDGSSISADDLKKLFGGDKDVEEVKEKGFTSQYKKVIDAVKEAGNGDIKTFKVQIDGTRAEYYVVSVNEKEGKVVGLKALSVES